MLQGLWYHYRGRMKGSDINSLGLLPDKLKTELAIHVNLETLKRVSVFFIFCNVLTVLYYNIVDMEPVTYFLFLLHYFIGYHFPRVPTWILARSGFEDEGVHIHPRRLDMSPGGGSQRDVYYSRWSCGNNQVSRTHNDMTTESLKDFWNRDNQHLVSMLQITFLYFIRKGNYRGHFQGYLILHNNKWSRWR